MNIVLGVIAILIGCITLAGAIEAFGKFQTANDPKNPQYQDAAKWILQYGGVNHVRLLAYGMIFCSIAAFFWGITILLP